MNIFEILDYRQIFSQLIARTERKGTKSRLAKALLCQSAYISRILAGRADLSTDQLVRAAAFFGLTEIEREYWLNVLLENRSADRAAKTLFRNRALELRQSIESLSNRLRTGDALTQEQQVRYYRSWLPSTIHMAVRNQKMQRPAVLAEALGVPLASVTKALGELTEMGLVNEDGGRFWSTDKGVHLDSESPWISRHHANWRHKTAERMSRDQLEGLHYSSAISCSASDLPRIKDVLIEALQKVRKIVSKSGDETVAHYAIDFYGLLDDSAGPTR